MKTISEELGLNESNDESDNNGSNKFDDDECYVLKFFLVTIDLIMYAMFQSYIIKSINVIYQFQINRDKSLIMHDNIN